jgi:lysophospholipase L1-like esterase
LADIPTKRATLCWLVGRRAPRSGDPGEGDPPVRGRIKYERKGTGVRWRNYVAVGDSFTEGMVDPDPSGIGYRGWADLVAGRLAQEYRNSHAGRPKAEEVPDFRYANLAIRGRLFDAIVDQQIPDVLRMRPDLVSFAGGGNDVLRRNFVPAALVARFDDVVRMLRANEAEVIIFRWADVTSRLPGRRFILPRMEILNHAVGEVADKYGAILVDLWHDPEFQNPRLWGDDRLHMSTIGHRRVAAHVLTALGLTPDPEWFATAPPIARRSWPVARAHDLRWARQHLAPWVKRRLTGRSSGDTAMAKRPTLAPVDGPHSASRGPLFAPEGQ